MTDRGTTGTSHITNDSTGRRGGSRPRQRLPKCHSAHLKRIQVHTPFANDHPSYRGNARVAVLSEELSERTLPCMGMISPQFGIFAQGTHAHHFLEFDLRPGVTPEQAVASFKWLRAPEVSAGGINLVIAFRGEVWRSVAPASVPGATEPFVGIDGAEGHGVPATPHDVWVWISGGSPDVTWQHARGAALAVDDVASIAFEQAGFTYLDS